MQGSSFRSYKLSQHCQRLVNPIMAFGENEIRGIPASELADPLRPKDPINVSFGDPTFYKDFKPHSEDLKVLSKAVGKYDGYVDFSGIFEVRSFLKDFYSLKSACPLDESGIFITHGCSLALWLAINSLADSGDNILLPKVGFCFPKVIAESHLIGVQEYELLAEKNWEIDLKSLEGLINERTRAILVNNPCNPTGSVFSRQHIAEILMIAEKHGLPIIADEVYGNMVYPGVHFVSFIELNPKVPVLLCSGLSKKFFGPGWRTGWLVLHGPDGVFDEIKKGVINLLSIVMNSNTICMQSIPEIVGKEPAFLEEKMAVVEKRTGILKQHLNDIDCFKVSNTEGAIYALIWVDLEKLENIANTKDFCIKLFKTQNVVSIPAECFGGKGFIRVVTCSDEEMIVEFCKRMREFYYNNKKTHIASNI